MLKRKSKRVLSIVLAVAMIVGLFSIAAFADEGTTPAEAKTISVDGTTTTLASAAQQANDGDTIQLTSDIKLQTGVDFDDTVTLDLNGHTIADENWTSGDYLVSVKRGGELTIEDSSTDQTGAITASSSNEKLYAAVKITLTGEDEATTPANLIVNGGTLTGYYYGISGNGTRHNTNIEINGGKIVGTNGAGIYHPQDGVLTVTNGEITGEDTAIELRSGKLNISGGSFTATASEYAESQNNSGTTVSGAAIAISQHTTKKNISVNITGGTFNGVYALSETNVQNADATENVEIVAINGGTFNGKVKSSDCTKFVSGGSFNEQVAADYVAAGYECVKDESSNMYVIQTASQMEASSEVSGDGTTSTTVGGSFTPSTDAGDNVNTANTTLNIIATTGDQGAQNASVTESNVTIAPEALSSVNDATSVQNVAIKTDVATVTVDSAAWNAMTTNAGGTESVTLSVEKKTVAGSAPLTYTLTATNASGDDVYSASNAAGAITISVPYSNGSNPKVFYVGSKGLEDMNASLTDGILSWIARHFSDYVVLDDSVIATITTSDGNVSSYIDAAAFATAVKNAADGSVVGLMKNITLDATGKANTQGILTITKNITINGNGKTITAENVIETPSMINVQSGANVTINDLIINGGTNDTFTAGTKHGININQAGTVTLNDVTIQNNRWYAVMNNGSNLVLHDLITTGNQWGVNIDNKGGNTVLTVNNATINENSSIVFDKNNADGKTPKAVINAGSFKHIIANETVQTPDLLINGGTFATGEGPDGSVAVEKYLASGLEFNPVTGQVYKEPEYTGKFSHEIFTTVGDNGAIDVDRYATEGDKVTITVSPDEAYMLDKMTLTSGGKDVEVTDNGDGTYTFTMPSGDVKIEVTFAEDPNWEPEPEEPAMPFVDVNENDWFYDVVLYAYENGLMTGTSADTFAPNQTTTRGMIVSMLARLEGVTSAEDAGFADVAENDWYATAVNWAASVGVVNGYEDNTFRPNAPITREQMAAILYNYADYKGYDVSARADLSDYADAADVSSWAEDVLSWANAEGLINGMTATTIDPQGATTRAQTAAMFERFLTAHEA